MAEGILKIELVRVWSFCIAILVDFLVIISVTSLLEQFQLFSSLNISFFLSIVILQTEILSLTVCHTVQWRNVI